MERRSAGQRGISMGIVLFALAVGAAIVALGRGCDEEPASPGPQAALPPPPAALPALPPAPAADPAPAVAAAAPPQPPRGVSALVVHNPCNQPLLMAVSFVDANGVRTSEGLFQIGAGARMVPAGRSGPVHLHDKTIHYYTETLATEPVEAGRRDVVVADRQVGMKSVELDPPAVSTITLECPGATSGRP